MSEKGVALTVKEITPNEVARGIARISSHTMQYLGLNNKDPIAIVNAKAYSTTEPETIVLFSRFLQGDGIRKTKLRTVASALPITREHNEQDIIMLDGLTRRNANVQVNETAIVSKVRAVTADKVVFSLLDNFAWTTIQQITQGDIKRLIFAELDQAYVTIGDMLYPLVSGLRFALTVNKIEPQYLEQDYASAALMDKQNTVVELKV